MFLKISMVEGRRPIVPEGNPDNEEESRGEPNNASSSQGVTLPTSKISDFTKTFLEQVKGRQLGYTSLRCQLSSVPSYASLHWYILIQLAWASKRAEAGNFLAIRLRAFLFLFFIFSIYRLNFEKGWTCDLLRLPLSNLAKWFPRILAQQGPQFRAFAAGSEHLTDVVASHHTVVQHTAQGLQNVGTGELFPLDSWDWYLTKRRALDDTSKFYTSLYDWRQVKWKPRSLAWNNQIHVPWCDSILLFHVICIDLLTLHFNPT